MSGMTGWTAPTDRSPDKAPVLSSDADAGAAGASSVRRAPAAAESPPAHPDLPGYRYLTADVYEVREPQPERVTTPGRDEPAAPAPGRWPVLRLAGGAAALVVVAVVVLVVSGLGGDDGEGPAEAGSTAGAVGGGSAAAAVAVPGLVATASVVGADDVAVVEVVTWPDGGPAEIRLGLPELSALPGVPPTFEPRVAELEVTLDGSAAPVALDGAGTGWTVPHSAGAPSTMVVRYVLSGALVRSAPSESGRALLLVAPLSQPGVGSLPVRVELPQDGVLGVGCPGAAEPADQLCGRRQSQGWTAEPPAGSPAVVVVQLDLPPT